MNAGQGTFSTAKSPFRECCTKATGGTGVTVCYGKCSHFICGLFAPHPFYNMDIAFQLLNNCKMFIQTLKRFAACNDLGPEQ